MKGTVGGWNERLPRSKNWRLEKNRDCLSMTENAVQIIAALATLGILAVLARLIRGTWVAPSALLPLAWGIFILVPLVAFGYHTTSARAVWVIALLVFCAQAGALVGEHRSSLAVSRKVRRWIDPQFRAHLSRRLLVVSLWCTATALAGGLFYALAGLAHYGLSLSIDGFLSLGSFNSVFRYRGGQEAEIVRALIAWVYPGGLLGGMACALAVTLRQRAVSLLPFAPALLFGAAEAARAGIGTLVCCWAGGFLAMSVWATGGNFVLFHRKRMVWVVGLLICGVSLSIIVDSIRAHNPGRTFEIRVNVPRLQSMFFGYLPAFSRWVDSQEPPALSYGAYTFAGTFELLEIRPRKLGIYATPVLLTSGQSTNIYTAYRGLIEDVSLPGATIVMLVLGFGSGLAYRRLCEGRHQFVTVLSAFYATLLWSPVISLFVYNDLLGAWVIAVGVLAWNGRRAARIRALGKFAATTSRIARQT